MADTELQQLVVWVGTTEKIEEARTQGLITENDFVITTDAPEFQEKLTAANAGTGISITEVGGVVKISNTQTSAEWGNIQGSIQTQTDLWNYLSQIGVLSSLSTTVKTDLVSAINEVYGIADTALQPSDIVDSADSTATDKALSANMGKSLQDQIDNLSARGRFLALWNCATGLAQSNPPESPYTYKTGDYFIVGTVASAGGTNYRPNGATYTTGVPSITVETAEVSVDDVYYYDGQVWRLQVNTQKTVSFVNIAGDPYDNSNLAAAFNQKQDTLVSGTNIKTINSTTVLGTGNFALADQSLSNLTSTGKNIGNWSTNVSNCILEIPQDFKLELSNGTLTLKSGSIYTKTDGSQYIITSDITSTTSSNGIRYVFINSISNNLIVGSTISETCSGPTDSLSGVPWHTWYDTTNNLIKRFAGDGTTVGYTSYSLPIAIVTVSNSAISSIDQVFNGAGYIGHHQFTLPGVKALISNGFNTDGTLKSTLVTRSSLHIRDYGTGTDNLNTFIINETNVYNGRYNGVVNTRSEISSNGVYFIKDENKMIQYYNGSFGEYGVLLTSYSLESGVVTQFDVRQPVRLATTEMLDELQPKIDGAIQGVQINGTELTPDANNKVNIPVATSSNVGVVMIGAGLGLSINQSTGNISVQKASDSEIIAKSNSYKPVVPANLDKAVMEGLGNNDLTWTEEYKTSARNTIGATRVSFVDWID